MKIFFADKYLILIFLIPAILTLIWFRDGNFLGTGETGVSFYNLNQTFGISGWAWGVQTLGNVSGLTVAAGPFYGFLSIFQNMGISGVLLEALFFYLLLFLTLYSMYRLSKELFPDLSYKFHFSAALFYLFNSFSVMNIWNRFLLNTILFYSLMPLVMALLIQGLRLKRYYFAILISVITAISSFAFGSPAQTVIFWAIILLIVFYHFIFISRSYFAFKFFAVFAFFWTIFNLFWILQEIYFRFSSVFETSTEAFFTSGGNKYTFDVLSAKLGQITNLLLLKHGTSFSESYDLPFAWPLFYSNPLTLALEWLVILLILWVVIKNLKNRWVGFCLFIFMIGIFASKGNSPPFGEIFNFLFDKISLFQFFRNPFEKLAILLALSLSPLFGLMISEVSIWVNRKIKLAKLVIFLNLLYLFFFLGFPFWTNLIFTSGNPPSNNISINYQIKVPDYYKQANKWLNSQKDIFRFISLPIASEGISNTWLKGYLGIELSGVLFETPNLSYNTTIPYYHPIVEKLEKLFKEKIDFYKIASLLNVRYLMLRSDLDFKLSSARDPNNIDKILTERIASKSARLKLENQFEALKFYSYDEDTFLPKIYPGKKAITTSKIGELEDFFLGYGDKGDFLILDKEKIILDKYHFQKSYIARQNGQFYIPGPKEFLYSEDSLILPFASESPGNITYTFIQGKEKLLLSSTKSKEEKVKLEVQFLGKRITELKNAINSSNALAASEALSYYQQNFPAIFSEIMTLPPSIFYTINIWEPQYVMLAFGTHINVLEEAKKILPEGSLKQQVLETENLILDKLSSVKLIAKHRPIIKEDFPLQERIVYQFNLSEDGEYEFLFPKLNIDKYFTFPKEITIQINDEIIKKQLYLNEEGYLSMGKIYFYKGLNEIGFNIPSRVNLVDFTSDKTLKTVHDEDRKEFKLPIKDFDPYSPYFVMLDYYIRSGDKPSVYLEQNTDPKKNDGSGYRHSFEKTLPWDNYWFDFRSFSDQVNPNSFADTANLVFTVNPFNDCKSFFSNKQEICKDPTTKKSFDRISEVTLKNIRLVKIFPQEPLLRKTKSDNNDLVIPNLKFEKINQTKYKVRIEDAREPFILIFSELFNKGWRIYNNQTTSFDIQNLSGTNSLFYNNHFLVNDYANGWLIDKTGSFDLTLEFWPQKLLVFGYGISSLGILLGFILIFRLRRRENEKNY